MTETGRPTQRASTAKRRQDILEAALECFIDKGFDATSLRQIAARAKMTHAGLLHHYESKEALIAALLLQRDERDSAFIRRAAGQAHGGTGYASPLFALLAQHQAAPGEMRFWGELFASASRKGHASGPYFRVRYQNVRATMGSELQRRMEAGALKEGVNPELAAILLAAVLDGLQSQWLLDPELPITAALDHFLNLILGPGAQAGDDTPTPDRSVSSGAGSPTRGTTGSRSQLLAAAVRVFTAKGFAGASIADVAAAAGCSKAAVLYHFATKRGLLHEVLEPLNEALNGLLALISSLPPHRRTSIGVPALIQLTVQHRALVGLADAPFTGDDGDQSSVPLWGGAAMLELLAGSMDTGVQAAARFALAGIPGFCRASAALTDEALGGALQTALQALLLRTPRNDVEECIPVPGDQGGLTLPG